MVTRTLISRLVQDISHLYPAKNVKDLIRSLGEHYASLPMILWKAAL